MTSEKSVFIENLKCIDKGSRPILKGNCSFLFWAEWQENGTKIPAEVTPPHLLRNLCLPEGSQNLKFSCRCWELKRGTFRLNKSQWCATEMIFKYLLASQHEDHCLNFLILSDSIFTVIKDHWISSCSFFSLETC